MFQQRISAHTHRRRRNTLLGAEDNAVAEWWYQLSAKAKSGNTRISLFPDPKGTIHNTGKPYVVQPKTDTYRSLAENNPKQPQPTGNRNDRVVAWHHVEHERGKRIILPERPCNLATLFTGQGWKVSSEKSCAGSMETYFRTQFAILHRLWVRTPSWVPLWAEKENWSVLYGNERTTDHYLIILMKWWIREVTYCLTDRYVFIKHSSTTIADEKRKHHFSFGKQSDEKKMNRYNSV